MNILQEEVRNDMNLTERAKAFVAGKSKSKKIDMYYNNKFRMNGYYTLLSNAINEDFTADIVRELGDRVDLSNIDWSQFFKDMRYEVKERVESEKVGNRVRLFVLSRVER